MVEMFCPVREQRLRSPNEIVPALPNEITDQDREQRALGSDDKLTRVNCSLGSCAVRGLGEIRIGQSTVAVSFSVEQASECELAEEPRQADVVYHS